MKPKLMFFPRERRELHEQFFLRVESCEDVEMGQGSGEGGRIKRGEVPCWEFIGGSGGLEDD
jgi:hypothetical protein